MSKKKTVLLVGHGGREHALAWKLSQSPGVGALYAAPGNAGLAELGTCVPVEATDIEGQVQLARDVGADLVVVCPEAPLALGLVDELIAAGFAAVGPTAAAARIESSKSFAKQLMERAGIPTAGYDVATDMETATAIIRRHFTSSVSVDAPPLVVKADGLASGRGVIICRTEDEALAAAESMLSGEAFGRAGATVIIEEYMSGPEVSIMVFTDGRHIVPMPPAQDYQRVFTGDKGPNTGGMGSVSPVDVCDDALHEEILRTCVQPAIDELARQGTPFRGILFAGLMLTPAGPRVLEFNARFGDPETQSVLRRLESDLLPLLSAVAAGDLGAFVGDPGPADAGSSSAGAAPSPAPVWSSDAACCVIMAVDGYPGEITTNEPIAIPENLPEAVQLFHGGTARDDAGRLVTSRGRVLSVTATGPRLEAAVNSAYTAAGAIDFHGAFYRTDIGRRSNRNGT